MTANIKEHTWKIVTGVVVIIGIVTGIWKFDDRYVKHNDLAHASERLEEQTVKTFQVYDMKQQTVQMKQETQYLGLKLDILNNEYDRVKDDLREVNALLEKAADNSDLKIKKLELEQELKDILEDIKNVRDKLKGVE